MDRMDKTVPPYKETECRSCKTKEVMLYFRTPMRDSKDFFCKECKDKGEHNKEVK